MPLSGASGSALSRACARGAGSPRSPADTGCGGSTKAKQVPPATGWSHGSFMVGVGVQYASVPSLPDSPVSLGGCPATHVRPRTPVTQVFPVHEGRAGNVAAVTVCRASLSQIPWTTNVADSSQCLRPRVRDPGSGTSVLWFEYGKLLVVPHWAESAGPGVPFSSYRDTRLSTRAPPARPPLTSSPVSSPSGLSVATCRLWGHTAGPRREEGDRDTQPGRGGTTGTQSMSHCLPSCPSEPLSQSLVPWLREP